MRKYQIAFRKWGAAPFGGEDICELAVFGIRIGDMSFPAKITLTRTVGASIDYNPQDEARRAIVCGALLRISLPRIKAKIDSMEVPSESSNNYLVSSAVSSQDLDLLKRELESASRKCLYQDSTPLGLLCRAASVNDELGGKTSKQLCAECGFPDDRIRCSMLQHPSVIGSSDGGGHSRIVSDAFCDQDTARPDASSCIPGGRNCWRQEIDNVPRIGRDLEDSADRVVDELKYLDLSFYKAFGHGLLRINDPRTVANLMGPCRGQEEFTSKIASISDLLSNFDLSAFASDIDPGITGSLNKLENLLQRRNLLVDGSSLPTLRSVVSIRNSFPIHSGNTRFLSAFEDLGLEYPPDDWDYAWRVILHHVCNSLRSLRQMLPT